MDSKLTIKLDKEVIEKAKGYATSHKRSLSRLIESYLRSLVSDENEDQEGELEITPFVKSLYTGVSIPSDLDYKERYAEYLSDKYK